jgi:hypothetical protein
MGFLDGKPKRGKHESLPLSELLKKSDREINKLIKSGEVPTEFTSAKVIRKAARKDKRQTERALGGDRNALDSALGVIAGLRGGGAQNYKANVPLRDQMHPAAYKALLQREAKRQGLL